MTTIEDEINELVEAELEKVLDALHIHPGCSPFYLHLLTGTSITTLNEMVGSGHITRIYIDLRPHYYTPEQIRDREREASGWEVHTFSELGALTIVADIRALTARISVAETTAMPTAALALQKARGHLLHASMAVERAQAEREMV